MARQIWDGLECLISELLEDVLESEEQLRKALVLQARQCGKTPLFGMPLEEMAAIEERDTDLELEREARERVRLYGKESPIE